MCFITLQGIEELNAATIIFIIGLLGGTVISGGLFLFIFKQDVFLKMEVSKLILLSCCISFPFLVINFIIALIQQSLNEEYNVASVAFDSFYYNIMLFMAFSLVGIYKRHNDLKIKLKQMIVAELIALVLIGCLIVFQKLNA